MYMLPKRAFSTIAIWILVVFTLVGTYRPVQAVNTLTVDIFEDEYDAVMWGKGCSLREAIQAAYLNDSVGGCQADSSTDTIFLPAGEYSLSISGMNEENGLTGDLDIRESITILGEGSDITKINAAGLGDRVLHILGGTGSPAVTIRDVQISGGWASSSDGGSGILNQGAALQLDRIVITGNSNQNYNGGGISNLTGSTLVLNNTTVSGNTGKNGGGISNARSAMLTVTGSTISNNTASYYGGGISNTGIVKITGSTLAENTAQSEVNEIIYGTGGGLFNSPYDSDVDYAQIIDTTITGNHAGKSMNGAGISSNGRLSISGSLVENNAGIGLEISGGSIASIVNSQFRGNTSTNPVIGAGIDCGDQLTIQNSQISANTGTGMVVKSGQQVMVTVLKTNIRQNSGLGLRVEGGARVTVTDSNVLENTPSDPSTGAGIASLGDLTLNNSTIAKNAGIGLLVGGGSAAVTNSTLGANNALVEPGINNSVGIASAGALTLHTSTIADHAGAGLRVDDGTAEAGASLFARNAGANCTMGASGIFTSLGYNLRDLAGDISPCLFEGEGDFVDVTGLDTQMMSNGGYTQTYALLDESMAIDAIDRTNTACLVVDQRGFGRPVDGNNDGDRDCDIGAFESGAAGFSISLPVIRR